MVRGRRRIKYIMRVITLAKAKEYLGISDTTYDAQITSYLPVIDAKVKDICRNNFNLQLNVGLTDTETTVVFSGIYNQPTPPELKQLTNDLPVGTLLEGTGIATDTYISEVYYNGPEQDGSTPPYFELSTAATADNSGVIYAGINIAYQPLIAKGIWWLISQMSTDICANDWISRSDGGMSVSRSAEDSKLDGKSGMPAWFVKGLPRWHR